MGLGAATWATGLKRAVIESRRCWRNKASPALTYDMLLIGDSRIYRGLSPAEMATSLPNRRILNFGFSGAGLSGHYLDAAAARLDRRSPHRAFVIGVTPHALTPDAQANEHLQECLGWWDTRAAAAGVPGVDETFALFSPLDLDGLMHPRRRAEEFHDDGWIALRNPGHEHASELQNYTNLFDRNRASPQIIDQLMAWISEQIANGVAIYAFRPPTSPAMVALENDRSGFDEEGVVLRLKAIGAAWIDPGISPRAYDDSHLDANSAIALSRRVAEIIARTQ